MWQEKIFFFLFSFSIYSSASKRNFLPSDACTSTEDHIDTHFDSSPLMTNSSAQKDLDLIELALRRLLSDDRLLIDGNLHDPPGEDAQSELIRKEKDRELLLRLLDQLHSLKGESGLKDCENSLPTDDTNSDSEPHGSDKIGGQVSNEEVMEEIRKVMEQNKLTHVILGIIFASNVIWCLSEMAVALLIRKQMSTPFKLIGSFITGNFRVPMAENHSSHNLKPSLLPRAEAYAIPHFEAPQHPHIEVPSNFRAEDKAVRILIGKVGYGSAGQAEENISLLDLLQPNPSRHSPRIFQTQTHIKSYFNGEEF